MASWSPDSPKALASREPAVMMDPERLFKINYHYAVSHADGIARFAYHVIPYSLLRSFCLTFDPTWKFRIGVLRISPVTRTRTLTKTSIAGNRVRKATRVSRTESRYPNTSSCQWPSPVPSISTNNLSNPSVLPAQEKTRTIMRDTTRATRPIGADHGEFEKFKFDIFTPDRRADTTYTYRQRIHTFGCDKIGYSNTDRSHHASTVGGCATFTQANIDSIRSSSITELGSLMQKKTEQMLPSTVPYSRRYSLARNLAELKDLPQTVASLQQGVRSIAQAVESAPRSLRDSLSRLDVPKNVPDQWLSYWFGWRLLYNDLVGLLTIPERISKEVNYLIERRGKPTTYRSVRKEAGTVSASPSFSFTSLTDYPTGLVETLLGQDVKHRKNHEFRLVINATFDFPGVGVPKLRRDLFERKFGANFDITRGFGLTPSDWYELIPWSWLVDWFTGLGNYVELVDVINTDPSIFNWGFLTGVTDGEVVHTYRTRTSSEYAVAGTGFPATVSQITHHDKTTEAVFRYQTQVRKNIVSAYGVKSTMELNSLSSYQSSIVGAIVATRFRR